MRTLIKQIFGQGRPEICGRPGQGYYLAPLIVWSPGQLPGSPPTSHLVRPCISQLHLSIKVCHMKLSCKQHDKYSLNTLYNTQLLAHLSNTQVVGTHLWRHTDTQLSQGNRWQRQPKISHGKHYEIRKFRFSGVLCRLNWQRVMGVSDQHNASIFRSSRSERLELPYWRCLVFPVGYYQ